jgi:hypothetical protein
MGSLVKCGDCGSRISKRAAACPICGRPLKAKRSGCLACVVFLALAFVLLVFLAPEAPKGTPRPGQGQNSMGPKASKPLAVGEEGVLELPGGGGVWLAIHDDDWNDMLDAENLGGKEGIESLLKMAGEGRAQRLLNGTRVKILKSSLLSRFVVVTEGDFKDVSGWVQAEFVHRR